MKIQYEKYGDFWKEIEVLWDREDEKYLITKRYISGENSQGHSMAFTKQEIKHLQALINKRL